MTNKCDERPNPLPVLSEKEDTLEAIDEALQDAVRRGDIVDTGERKWSKRTGRYEVVWQSKIFGH